MSGVFEVMGKAGRGCGTTTPGAKVEERACDLALLPNRRAAMC